MNKVKADKIKEGAGKGKGKDKGGKGRNNLGGLEVMRETPTAA